MRLAVTSLCCKFGSIHVFDDRDLPAYGYELLDESSTFVPLCFYAECSCDFHALRVVELWAVEYLGQDGIVVGLDVQMAPAVSLTKSFASSSLVFSWHRLSAVSKASV